MISFNGNPKDSEVANLIGLCYKAQGDTNNAIAYFRKAVQLNPKNSQANVNLKMLNNQ